MTPPLWNSPCEITGPSVESDPSNPPRLPGTSPPSFPMTFLHKAGHTMSALHNLATYPLRFRRIGRSWRDGWTALLLRLSASGRLNGVLGRRECSLRLKALPEPLTLRRANSDIFVVRDVFENQDYGVVRRMNLPPDATIVDLGANIGIASLYFAWLFPQSRI